MEKVYEDSLRLHEKYRGKLEIRGKAPLKDKKDLSLVYTPGVARVSEEISKDKTLAKKYTLKNNSVAVVSDGSAILGLGNLGALAAIPVMEGKAMLFKELAGIDAFPICLDTQDTDEIVDTVKRIAPVFGAVNLEDISAPRCFRIETRLKKELDIPVMHDDQHGSAVVVLAALINALKLRDVSKENVKIVISGAGAAGSGVVRLLVAYGFKDITICDRTGAIYDGREDLKDEKLALATITNKEKATGSLEKIIRDKDVFIGVSSGGIVNEKMVASMAPKPIVFALANPTPEIMPDAAKKAGAFIVATGRSDFSNQVNNALAFPGIFRGALDCNINQFTDDMFMRAAENLALYVKNPTIDAILPSVLDKGVVAAIASAIRH